MAELTLASESRLKIGFCSAAAILLFLLAVAPSASGLAGDDVVQKLVNYIFTGEVDPQDAPEIVDRKSCIVLVHEPRFSRFARYYLNRFRMDTARISKKYAGSKVLLEWEVEGDEIVLEYLKPDRRTVDYGFKSAHISLPGDIELTEKAIRLIFSEHCRAEKPKSPF